MKLLYCQDCGDFVRPFLEERRPRACHCGRHAVWREAEPKPMLWVFDTKGEGHSAPRAFVVGLADPFIHDPSPLTSRALFEATMRKMPPNTAIGRAGTWAVKYRPGITPDSGWAMHLPARSDRSP
jgi:hypothetical protein